MSGNLVSQITNIEFQDNIGIQINFTGSAVGTFNVQISSDYKQDSQGVVQNAGNWISLVLNPAPVAAGSANQIFIDMNQLSAPWIRLIYTASSSTGVLNAFISAKVC